LEIGFMAKNALRAVLYYSVVVPPGQRLTFAPTSGSGSLETRLLAGCAATSCLGFGGEYPGGAVLVHDNTGSTAESLIVAGSGGAFVTPVLFDLNVTIAPIP
jgi:hypothetical protein